MWNMLKLVVCGAVAIGCAPQAAAPDVPSERGEDNARSVESKRAHAEAKNAVVLECPPPIQGADKLVRPGTVMLVGEIHGTVEAPAAVASMACNAAQGGMQPVVLGLELPAENQPVIEEFLASDGGDQAVAALLEAPHFAVAMKDGRNSEAMQRLLESVRRWRHEGANLEVVCFDAPSDGSRTPNERDATMARTLVEARREHPDGILLALTGNIHNRTVQGVPWDEQFEPMGLHIREAFPEAVSLDFRSAGGTAWVCMSRDGEQQCDVTKLGGEDRGPTPFIELFDTPNESGFDGILYVGSTTASKPAELD